MQQQLLVEFMQIINIKQNLYSIISPYKQILFIHLINKVKHMIFLGSSCVYPRNCKQPIKEEYLLNGELEKTNEHMQLQKLLDKNVKL